MFYIAFNRTPIYSSLLRHLILIRNAVQMRRHLFDLEFIIGSDIKICKFLFLQKVFIQYSL